MKSILKFLALFLLVNFLTNCKHNPLDVDTSNIDVQPIIFKRLDKDLLKLNPTNIST